MAASAKSPLYFQPPLGPGLLSVGLIFTFILAKMHNYGCNYTEIVHGARFILNFFCRLLERAERMKKLPKREIEICCRLRVARRALGFSQEECARQIGIDRGTLANYEVCRSPVRYDTALRFCRQFIISEEWLATGRCDTWHKIGEKRGEIDLKISKPSDLKVLDDKMFRRQCLDLLSDPVTLHVPQNALFSVAYDDHLKAIYQNLAPPYYHSPRIVFSKADNPELGRNLIDAMMGRYVALLDNEALRTKRNPTDVSQNFYYCTLEAMHFIFVKFLGQKMPASRLEKLDWLRRALTDPDCGLGPLCYPIAPAENIIFQKNP